MLPCFDIATGLALRYQQLYVCIEGVCIPTSPATAFGAVDVTLFQKFVNFHKIKNKTGKPFFFFVRALQIAYTPCKRCLQVTFLMLTHLLLLYGCICIFTANYTVINFEISLLTDKINKVKRKAVINSKYINNISIQEFL